MQRNRLACGKTRELLIVDDMHKFRWLVILITRVTRRPSSPAHPQRANSLSNNNAWPPYRGRNAPAAAFVYNCSSPNVIIRHQYCRMHRGYISDPAQESCKRRGGGHPPTVDDDGMPPTGFSHKIQFRRPRGLPSRYG